MTRLLPWTHSLSLWVTSRQAKDWTVLFIPSFKAIEQGFPADEHSVEFLKQDFVGSKRTLHKSRWTLKPRGGPLICACLCPLGSFLFRVIEYQPTFLPPCLPPYSFVGPALLMCCCPRCQCGQAGAPHCRTQGAPDAGAPSFPSSLAEENPLGLTPWRGTTYWQGAHPE